MYDSITIKYAAFTANTKGSYWAAKGMVVGEGSTDEGWPISAHDRVNYEVRSFNALDNLEYCKDLVYVDAVKLVFNYFSGSVTNMSEAENTDFYIIGLEIVESKDNVTVSFKDGDSELKTLKIGNGGKVESFTPQKVGYLFDGWYSDESFNTEFDFTEPILLNTTIYAKFVEAIKYIVKIETEYYEVSNSTSSFSFPSSKEYRDSTSEFASDLGLFYDSINDYYYAYGRIGTIPSFKVLLDLPDVYHLEGLFPTELIKEETVTYSFKYSINEEALGYPINKIHVSWPYDETSYKVGLFRVDNHAGFMILTDKGCKKAYSTPIQISFDNLDVSLYEEIKVYATSKYENTGRNVKWFVSGDIKDITDINTCEMWMKAVPTSFDSFIVDLKDVITSTNQSILKQLDVRPAVIDSEPNSLYLFIDKIVVKEYSNNHTVTFKDGDNVIASVKVADGLTIKELPQAPTKEGYYFDSYKIHGSSDAFTKDTIIQSDLTVDIVYEEIVGFTLYKVNIYLQSIEYTQSSIVGQRRISTYPLSDSKITYVNSTSSFIDLLSLDSEGRHAGIAGDLPSFDALDNLPFFKLNTSLSNALEAIKENDTVYNLYYDIDEEELGFSLSAISFNHFEYRVDKASISLVRDASTGNAGIMCLFNLNKDQGQFFGHYVCLDINERIEFFDRFNISYTAFKNNASTVGNYNLINTDLGDSEASSYALGTNVTYNLLAQADGAYMLNSLSIELRCNFTKTENSSIGLIITNVDLKRKDSIKTVTFKDEGRDDVIVQVLSGETVLAPSWTKEGYVLSWDKELTNITQDTTINAVWTKDETEALYKVTIKVVKYDFIKDSSNKRCFYLGSSSYVDVTSEFNELLGLDTNNMKSGKIGSTPSFSELSALPQTFKLNTTLSSISGLITEDGYAGYTLVYDIDEEALGITLDKIYLYDPINTDGYTFKTTPYLTLSYESADLCGVKISYVAQNKTEIRVAFDDSINFNDYDSVMLEAKVKGSNPSDKSQGFMSRPFTIVSTDKGNTEYYSYSNNAWGRLWGDSNDTVFSINTDIITEAQHTQAKADATLTNITTLEYVSIVHIPWYNMNNSGNGIEVTTYLNGITITMK